MAKKREPDNIDMDCIRAMALGYGVHYGRFKADYPHTADRDEVVPKYPPSICPQCGTEFLPGRDNQKYCSEECKYDSTGSTGCGTLCGQGSLFASAVELR